jgi:hypothetical protein
MYVEILCPHCAAAVAGRTLRETAPVEDALSASDVIEAEEDSLGQADIVEAELTVPEDDPAKTD